MIETQISQIAATIPRNYSGEIPGQPKNSLENVNGAADQWKRDVVQLTKNVEPLPKVNR